MAVDVVGDIIAANQLRQRLPVRGIPVDSPIVDRIIEASRERLRIPPRGVRTDIPSRRANG